jgi:hypothetical protein
MDFSLDNPTTIKIAMGIGALFVIGLILQMSAIGMLTKITSFSEQMQLECKSKLSEKDLFRYKLRDIQGSSDKLLQASNAFIATSVLVFTLSIVTPYIGSIKTWMTEPRGFFIVFIFIAVFGIPTAAYFIAASINKLLSPNIDNYKNNIDKITNIFQKANDLKILDQVQQKGAANFIAPLYELQLLIQDRIKDIKQLGSDSEARDEYVKDSGKNNVQYIRFWDKADSDLLKKITIEFEKDKDNNKGSYLKDLKIIPDGSSEAVAKKTVDDYNNAIKNLEDMNYYKFAEKLETPMMHIKNTTIAIFVILSFVVFHFFYLKHGNAIGAKVYPLLFSVLLLIFICLIYSWAART